MEQWYNLDNLEASFKEYLLAGNNKPVSIKNYLSDFRHFAGWLSFYLKSHQIDVAAGLVSEKDLINQISTLITANIINDYKAYLLENNIPAKTINRRLSTVRKFCSFCISQGWMKENPAKQVLNIKKPRETDLTQILADFKSDILKENLDQPTIKSFLNDIEEFLATL